MAERRVGRRRAWRVIGFAVGAGLIVTLAACEHARYWRDAEPWSVEFIREMSDPVKAHAELARRMAPPPPAALPEEFDSAIEYIRVTAAGCISCHGEMDEPDMHPGRTVAVSCVDCHGGNGGVMSPLDSPGRPGEPGTQIEDEEYLRAMQAAHIQPRNPEAWYGRDHPQDGRKIGEHPHHGDPEGLHGSRTPENTYTLLNQESPEFIRFINPGDLRVVSYTCASCHAEQVADTPHSMMAHGAMLWSAAMYNNAAAPYKEARHGESYSPFGIPERRQGVVEFVRDEEGQRVKRVRRPTEEEARRGVLPYLDPLAVWNVAQPGNILRIFERGTLLPIPGGPTPNPDPAEIGNPNPLVEGGLPDKKLSPRGLGTLNRTDPVILGLQKTRLLDPTLNFMGTMDHPGDFRASGCTACHSPYANDRDLFHSGQWAEFGHLGRSASDDPTIPKDQPGHPIKHAFTTAIPNSQCVTCHMHPGTSFANQYLGYMWWDNQSDGEHMYPATSHNPTPDERWRALRKNPEAAHLKGLWGNLYPGAVSHAGDEAPPDFLERTGGEQFNARLDHNQFADFHGHGWIFRAVFKQDREGNLLTEQDEVIDPHDPDKWDAAVHLKDVHLNHGMHCVDCHFTQDSHGDGKLYGETRNAVEVSCIDCHGTYRETTNFRTSGPAAVGEGRDMTRMRVGPRLERRFWERDGRFFQRSSMDPEVVWELTQTLHTIDPGSRWAQDNPEAAESSRYAKTIQRDGETWGDLPTMEGHPEDHVILAHDIEGMECYTCHTSWMTSCFGCHLPMKANERTPMLHNEGLYTRNYTQYNFQVLRDDVFMLGHDGVYKSGELDEEGNIEKPGRIVPVRSSSAVLVSSQNQDREWVYHQQQTVSAEGYSGQAFSPHFPHAVSGRGTTKQCADCHVSSDNTNNAWMAQLLMQGTNFVNFFGKYIYVATGGDGLEAVPVSEHDEPQAIYGSHLHSLAYPDEYERFVGRGRDLGRGFLDQMMYHHGAGWGNEILDLQVRGEYLYTARGRGGFYAYDVANIDNKGFSERIVTAPVSPLGQRLGFNTRYAVAVASPATVAVDPGRHRFSDDPTQPPTPITEPRQPHHPNMEQAIHPLYAYLYIGDRYEGLILTNAATLLDGDPTNNFMSRATLADGSDAFNPDGILDGLTNLIVAGNYVYATAASGLVVIDIDEPLNPRVVATVGTDFLRDPVAVAVQFRYAFITDADGLKVVEIADPTNPRPVEGAVVPLNEANRLYVARTNAYVAAGSEGIAIIEVTNPEQPSLTRMFDADGRINDARDVKVGMTNASLFAYVADGNNGLKVIELMGPHSTHQFRGFSPPVEPKLIAEHHTHGPALAVSKGLDRDRAVDETGNQVAVFGRIGARPMNLEMMRRLFMRDGEVWTVTNDPETAPRDFTYQPDAPEPPAPPARPGPPRPGPPRPGGPPR